jgi:3-dehydroquinate dehydratase type I
VKPRICVPLPVERLSDLASMIRRAENLGADLVEVRLDYLQDDILVQMDNVKKIISQVSVPLIATDREYSQGGKRVQEEGQRVRTLVEAAEIGFQYVDIELSTTGLKPTVRKFIDLGSKPIISFHDFRGTPSDFEMERIVKSQIEAGAAVCKVITTADTLDDSIRCLLFSCKTSKVTDIVCFAMGSQGVISRILSPLFGAFFTFSSLETGLETASGQVSLSELKELYRKLGVEI